MINLLLQNRSMIAFSAAVLFLSMNICAQQVAIIPQPVDMKKGSGAFLLKNDTKIYITNRALEKTGVLFNDYISNYYGFELPVKNSIVKADDKAIVFEVARFDKMAIPGAYKLQVTDKQIRITGNDPEGVFYGVQSLIRLLPLERNAALRVPSVAINDAPRFAYRGLNLDVSRHFFPVDFLKKYIDIMASYKLNVFHWHLTDDQGWRIDIKKYPLLTQTGSKRNGTIKNYYPGTGNNNIPYDGYYTQEEVKQFVTYAAERYITVIPEIEMPGHSSAAIAAYPFLSCFPARTTSIPLNMVSLKTVQQAQDAGRRKFVQETWGVFDDVYCAGKDATFDFLQDVLEELLPLFPSKYIHIGGDECPKTNWKQCPRCQKRMKKLQLKDEHALQSYFIQRIEKYLNNKGRQIIGWDEILEGGLAPNATVMSWRGEQGGIEAARQQHTVIMTPANFCYLNRKGLEKEDSVTAPAFLPIERVYNYNPVPASLTAAEARFIIGAQASVWTEYITNPDKLEYMLFPRLSAMSEVLWTDPVNKSWLGFQKRVLQEQERFEWMGYNYNRKIVDNIRVKSNK